MCINITEVTYDEFHRKLVKWFHKSARSRITTVSQLYQKLRGEGVSEYDE